MKELIKQLEKIREGCQKSTYHPTVNDATAVLSAINILKCVDGVIKTVTPLVKETYITEKL